jgi:hypothetical protein
MPTSHRYFRRVRISSSSSLQRLRRHRACADPTCRRVEEPAQPVRCGISIRSCRHRPGSASSCARVQCTPAGMKRLCRRQHGIGLALRADAPQQALGLQARAAAGRRTACSCGTWTAARGCASCRPCSPGTRRSGRTPYHCWFHLPFQLGEPSITQCCCASVSLYQGVSRGMPARFGVAHQVVLAFLPGRRLHGLDRAGAQA